MQPRKMEMSGGWGKIAAIIYEKEDFNQKKPGFYRRVEIRQETGFFQ
jgi:hypothetical protein